MRLFFQRYPSRVLSKQQIGAAIPEFLIALPVILIFFVGIFEVGRLIFTNNYMKVIAYDTAMLGAGSAEASRVQLMTERATTLYQNSAVKQLNASSFSEEFFTDNSIQFVRVGYQGTMSEVMPAGLGMFIPPVNGSVTLPVLTTVNNGSIPTEPANGSNTYCPDGSIRNGNNWSCNGAQSDPTCPQGIPHAWCSGNPICGQGLPNKNHNDNSAPCFDILTDIAGDIGEGAGETIPADPPNG